MPIVKLTSAHVRWFRLRRSGLVKPFSTPDETARRLIGVQAQLKPAANLAFWNRTSRCTLAGLTAARLDGRSIVRMWGQRNTLHLYDSDDWPLLHAAFEPRIAATLEELVQAGALSEFRRLVKHTATRLARGKPLTYKDIKSTELGQFIKRAQATAKQAQWVAAYLVFLQLVRQGVACHGPDQGNESSFVHRGSWLPDLAWSPPDSQAACAELARRYLSAYGPAKAQDLAHWYGTSVTNAKRWIESAGRRCCTVVVDGQTLWCCRTDLKTMAVKPPPPSRWPVRLLYRFDPLLLATKDKSWLIDHKDKQKVWLPAAHVNAVLLVRGRIAGTWRYDRKAKGLSVGVVPFSKLSGPVARATETQAAAIAKFLEMPLADFQIKGA